MTDNFKFQASFKIGERDQHMVNVRADSSPEFQTNVRELNSVAHDLYLAAETLNSGSVGSQPVGAGMGATSHAVSAPVQQQASGWTQPATPQQQPQQQPQPQPQPQQMQQCAHGAMTFHQGMSKAGKPYRAFFCNGPEGQKCSPVWV